MRKHLRLSVLLMDAVLLQEVWVQYAYQSAEPLCHPAQLLHVLFKRVRLVSDRLVLDQQRPLPDRRSYMLTVRHALTRKLTRSKTMQWWSQWNCVLQADLYTDMLKSFLILQMWRKLHRSDCYSTARGTCFRVLVQHWSFWLAALCRKKSTMSQKWPWMS